MATNPYLFAVANDTHFIPRAIKGIAGDLFSEFGCERSAENLPPEAGETDARLRDWWENAESRRRRPRAAEEGSS